MNYGFSVQEREVSFTSSLLPWYLTLRSDLSDMGCPYQYNSRDLEIELMCNDMRREKIFQNSNKRYVTCWLIFREMVPFCSDSDSQALHLKHETMGG